MYSAKISRGPGLTNRERAIIALAGRGMTNQEIGDELKISIRTVKCLLHRACVKLGARNRDRAVIQALKSGDIGIHNIFTLDELAELLASTPPEFVATVADRARHFYQLDQAVLNAGRAPVTPAMAGSS